MKPFKRTGSNETKDKVVEAQTPIRLMNKSQVSMTSEVSVQKTQKVTITSQSSSQRIVQTKSGSQRLSEKIDEETGDITELKKEIAELKIMALSEDARQNLMKLQRFDRYIYPMESDRVLKKPIEEELRRLEKIKNEQKQMRGKFYDNELTITALYNHIKLVYEMNRELDEREKLRKEKDDVVKQLHEQKRQSLKEVRELKEQLRMAGKSAPPNRTDKNEKAQGQTAGVVFKKEQITALNFITATLKGKKYVESLQQIRKFITKSQGGQPEVCRLFQMFIPALEDQIETITQFRSVQTKLAEINNLIQRSNKDIRANKFDELEKVKIDCLKNGSQHKNFGLLLESLLNVKKQDEQDKKKRVPGDNNSSLEKLNQRAKTTEQQLKAAREELIKQRTSNAEVLKIKQQLQKQVEKMKQDIQRLNSQLAALKKNQAQSRRNSRITTNDQELKTKIQELTQERNLRTSVEKQLQKLKTDIEQSKKKQGLIRRNNSRGKQSEEEVRVLKQELTSLRQSYNQLTKSSKLAQQELQKNKKYEAEVIELRKEIESLRKNEAQAKRSTSLKGKEVKDQSPIQNELTYYNTMIDRLVRISNGNRFVDQSEKLRKQLAASTNSSAKKLLLVLDQNVKWSKKVSQLDNQLREINKEKVEIKRKQDQENKSQNAELTEYKQNTNLLVQALKSTLRIWNRTRVDLLFKDNKITEVLSNELKKGNHTHQLQVLENQIIVLFEGVLGIVSTEISRVEDSANKKIELKDKQIEKINSRETTNQNSAAESNKKLKTLEDTNKKIAAENEQLKRDNVNAAKQIDKLTKELQKISSQSSTNIQQISKEADKLNKVNRELTQIKSQHSKTQSEKQQAETKLQEANQQISRLKKQLQDFVQQEKKVLSTLQLEGREKEKYIREQEILASELEKYKKEKQFYENKCHTQEADVGKYKQLMVAHNNLKQEAELEQQTLTAKTKNYEKEISSLNLKLKSSGQQNKQQQGLIKELQVALSKQKSELSMVRNELEQTVDLSQRQKRDLQREIEKLNQQIKHMLDQKQADRKHYTSAVARLEKNLADAESHRTLEIKQMQARITSAVQEREQTRRELELEQQRYREKLREVSIGMENASSTGQKEKVEMRAQISRLTSELHFVTSSKEAEKVDLQKLAERLTAQNKALQHEKTESQRIFKEEVERARNEEYQISYEKLKNQREQIRNLQKQVDSLHETIEINQGNYNRLVEENRRLFESLSQLETVNKSYDREISLLKDRSSGDLLTVNQKEARIAELLRHVDKLEGQIRQFEQRMEASGHATANSASLGEKVRELESRLDQINYENIRLRVLEQQSKKTIAQLREQNIELKSSYMTLDRELYASKTRNQGQRHQVSAVGLTEQIASKYEQVNQRCIEYRIQVENYERILRDRDGDIVRLNKDAEQQRRLYDEQVRQVQAYHIDLKRLQSKLLDQEKNYFLKEIELTKSAEAMQLKIRDHTAQAESLIKLQAQLAQSNGQTNLLKDQKTRLQKQILQTKNQVALAQKSIQLLQSQLHDKNQTIRLREQDLKQHLLHFSRNVNESANNSVNVPDLSGTLALLERTAEDRKREIERMQGIIDNLNKKYEEKSIEFSSLSLELKHAKMQREMLENNWRQKNQALTSNYKEIIKQVEILKNTLETKKNVYETQTYNLRIQKQRAQRNLEYTQNRMNDLKSDLEKIISEVAQKDQKHRIIIQRSDELSRVYEQATKSLDKLQLENKSLLAQLQEQRQKSQTFYRSPEVQLQAQRNRLRIETLQRELESKQSLVAQKQLQIREYITKLASHTHNDTAGFNSSKQVELQTSYIIMERNLDETKKSYAKLEHKVEDLTARLESKINEANSLALEVKRCQMEGRLVEEQNRYKVEGLSAKNEELVKETRYMHEQISKCQQLLTKHQEKSEHQKRALQARLHEASEQLQNERMDKMRAVEREKSLVNKVKMQEEEIREEVRNIKDRNKRVGEENKYLKEIVQMLDSNYNGEEADDQNEIAILQKISEQISYLVQRNIDLEGEFARLPDLLRKNDEQWLSSIDFLLESILAFLNESNLIGHRNITKFTYSAEFKAQSLHDHQQKYIVYVESFLKELFQNVVQELVENVGVYERTLSDVKKLLGLYSTTGEARYIQSLKRSLKHFQ